VNVVEGARLSGHHCQLMAPGTLKRQLVGDMEMIDKHGVKATFTDRGVEIDIVRANERCILCNDPRLLHEGMTKLCFSCGCRQ
jgi:hypothetical protein